MTEDAQAVIQGHVERVLELLGLDSKSEGLKQTPRRFAEYLMEFNQGLQPIEEALGTTFEMGEGYHSMVAQSKIPFRMICEHHLLPALGHAAIGYIPRDRVVGLSKLTRLVKAAGTNRPSLQEVICDTIADTMVRKLKPQGVIVVLEAEHSCMTCRGIAAPGVITATSAVRGVFRDVPQARNEFFSLIRNF